MLLLVMMTVSIHPPGILLVGTRALVGAGLLVLLLVVSAFLPRSVGAAGSTTTTACSQQAAAQPAPEPVFVVNVLTPWW